ncbi:NAD-dependent protein lipoamidase sirtuin-4, mitochondrial-like [Physella acuta]|uniref:NAD-dependent protein lipoamidase sirtuin-4, mitochondrial-like n=1 Tax=Physella acuta TaxID=109671 RepID=UPI0027DC42A2|nr:NAD-dependent protein lipoamidase sirtuin-4, mitochondrial-like [Physella acuta]
MLKTISFAILKEKHRSIARSLFNLKSNLHYQCVTLTNNLAESHGSSKFVPACEDVDVSQLKKLQEFISTYDKLFILTGAGISTESGIPDYRSEGVGLYATSTNRPVQYIDFLKKPHLRQRYWARNFIGWPRFSSFQPNSSHYTLSDWERKQKVHWLVTQNVDALHYKAGSQCLTELHGSAHRVHCLSCSFKISRHAFQDMIKELNPTWSADAVSIGPDGDVDLNSTQITEFKVPDCPQCKGILKPEIIFFGDNVAKDTVHFVLEKMFESDAVLVIGSSLEVYSGFRFVNRAKEHGMPIAVINIGPTRADKLGILKVSAKCSDVLQKLKLH